LKAVWEGLRTRVWVQSLGFGVEGFGCRYRV